MKFRCSREYFLKSEKLSAAFETLDYKLNSLISSAYPNLKLNNTLCDCFESRAKFQDAIAAMDELGMLRGCLIHRGPFDPITQIAFTTEASARKFISTHVNTAYVCNYVGIDNTQDRVVYLIENLQIVGQPLLADVYYYALGLSGYNLMESFDRQEFVARVDELTLTIETKCLQAPINALDLILTFS